MPPVTVIFHRSALREYQDAYRWYARRSPHAAQRFMDAVGRAVQKIAGTPAQWPVYQGPYRWVRTQQFPYLLYYRILDPARELLVAVAHTRRRPGYWLRRRP